MSVAWSDLGAEGRRRAEAHFIAASLAAGLRENRRDTARRPSFADLYAWATDPDFRMSSAQQAMVAADPDLRRGLALLVGRVGRLRAAAAAAASSGGLDRREGPGFTVRLTASRADAAQTYVSIDIDPASWRASAPPALLLVLRAGLPVARLALPDEPGLALQLLEATDSDIVRGLRDAGTDLVLV
jgi:hypothetical protein